MYPGDGASCLAKTNCKCHLEFHYRNGRHEIYWVLGSESPCKLCPEHAAEWNPLIVEVEE
jgi:hypothetical protein